MTSKHGVGASYSYRVGPDCDIFHFSFTTFGMPRFSGKCLLDRKKSFKRKVNMIKKNRLRNMYLCPMPEILA